MRLHHAAGLVLAGAFLAVTLVGGAEPTPQPPSPSPAASPATSPSPATAASPSPSPAADDPKVFYALGVVMGNNIKMFNLTPSELAQVKQGLEDAAAGRKVDVDLPTYGPRLQELARARMRAAMEAEKARGLAFRDTAAKEPGAVLTPSGMVYKEMTPGQGASPTAEDTVRVHYQGTLIDGTEFDSSIKRGQPAEFPLRGVIACWTEGLQRMKVGGKARLVCPSSIAYQDQGRPPTIPGGATLVFEVELLEVKPRPSPAASPSPSPSLAPPPRPRPSPSGTAPAPRPTPAVSPAPQPSPATSPTPSPRPTPSPEGRPQAR